MAQRNASQPELFQLDELKSYLAEIKELYDDAIASDPEYEGEADLVIETIANLEESLKGVTDINTLDKRKQARILADVTLLQTIHMSFTDEEGEEYDDEDEDFDDEDDEDDEDEDEDEDDEDE